jgi:hypothetical protein
MEENATKRKTSNDENQPLTVVQMGNTTEIDNTQKFSTKTERGKIHEENKLYCWTIIDNDFYIY